MAVTIESVKAPSGRVEPGMFPGEDVVLPGQEMSTLDRRLTAYLVEATEISGGIEDLSLRDKAIKAWIYHRAFDAASVIMDTNAASMTLNDLGSRSMLAEQIRSMRKRAVDYRDEYEDYTRTTVMSSSPQGTQAVQTIYSL